MNRDLEHFDVPAVTDVETTMAQPNLYSDAYANIGPRRALDETTLKPEPTEKEGEIKDFEEKSAIAGDIIQNGKLSDQLRRDFKEVLRKDPSSLGKAINVADLNKVLDKLDSDLRLKLVPTKEGLSLELIKDGATIDSVASTSPGAKSISDRMMKPE
jgi:hypothetical protein